MASKTELLRPVFKVTPKEPIPDLDTLIQQKIRFDPKMIDEMAKIVQELTESFRHTQTKEIIDVGQIIVYTVAERNVFKNEKMKKMLVAKREVTFKKKYKVGDYEVILKLEDEGIFSVEIPKLPSCITFGNTRKEALKNAQEAIDCHLEAIKKYQK